MKTKVDYDGNKVKMFKKNDVGDYYTPGNDTYNDEYVNSMLLTSCEHPKCKNQYRQRLYRGPNGEWNILNVHFCSKTCEDDFILMWQETLSSALRSKTGQRGMPLHLIIFVWFANIKFF